MVFGWLKNLEYARVPFNAFQVLRATLFRIPTRVRSGTLTPGTSPPWARYFLPLDILLLVGVTRVACEIQRLDQMGLEESSIIYPASASDMLRVFDFYFYFFF